MRTAMKMPLQSICALTSQAPCHAALRPATGLKRRRGRHTLAAAAARFLLDYALGLPEGPSHDERAIVRGALIAGAA